MLLKQKNFCKSFLVFVLCFTSCSPSNKCYNTKSAITVIDTIGKKILILEKKRREVTRQLDIIQVQHMLLSSMDEKSSEITDIIERLTNHISELKKYQQDLDDGILSLQDAIKIIKKFNGVSSHSLDQQLKGELKELVEISEED